jgi:hypothetical protein
MRIHQLISRKARHLLELNVASRPNQFRGHGIAHQSFLIPCETALHGTDIWSGIAATTHTAYVYTYAYIGTGPDAHSGDEIKGQRRDYTVTVMLPPTKPPR